ncbi:cobalamin biosynthesis protein [Caldichromatium japonicum]|uniref:Cobalamin biosynthesis protein n=1 Tax=Caldichromatium japonicum TaxID=2699430 RepID=A0A6G7VC03_9GAMM|nr:cobalamin biosynthesis protein [Caldichromatium japonicum]QIK37589.1 cobalamin biosynthesis protein [Caldichromatium japonicum]
MIEITIGLGFQQGIRCETLKQSIESLLKPLDPVAVCCLASHLQKSTDPVLRELAHIQGWPLRCYPSSALAQVPVAHPSTRVHLTLGTPSVAEAAALLAAAELSARGEGTPSLLVSKQVYRDAEGKAITLAIAQIGPRAM